MKTPNPSHKTNHHHHLSLNITRPSPPPAVFHCPISLEVMRSPVSLCTGVTYDRSSIARWLDSGHTTCPATMQSLRSTELIPNLALRRLIHQWSSSSSSSQHPPSLPRLANILSDPSVELEHKRSLLSSSVLRPSAIASLFLARETVGLAVTIVSVLLSLELFDAGRKRELTAAVLSELDAAASGIVDVLKDAVHVEYKVAAAGVLEMLIAESRPAVAEKQELMKEMLRLLEEDDAELVDAGLRCLMRIVKGGGKERMMMVRMGVVPTIIKLMEREGGDGIPATVVGKAMVVMELAAGCAEGLAAIRAEAKRCVLAVVGAMMKVGSEGREAAVAVLWRVCCGDQRGRDAACLAKGGLAKIMVVMQGDCSLSARKMAGDLLRVFWCNDRRPMAAGFDSKTIHVMPF